MMLAIFDIDGCISDDSWRQYLIPEGASEENDWDEYHEHSLNDRSINREVLLQHIRDEFQILFITARPERYRKLTMIWLEKHFQIMPREGWLLMRPEGNKQTSPELKVGLFERSPFQWSEVTHAYDDRGDVLQAYTDVDPRIKCTRLNINSHPLCPTRAVPVENPTPDNLRAMAKTYEERNAVYGDNYNQVTAILAILFPDGVSKEIYHTTKHNLLEMVVGKLTRFVQGDLKHIDSIHDLAVYAAMVETEVRKEEQ